MLVLGPDVETDAFDLGHSVFGNSREVFCVITSETNNFPAVWAASPVPLSSCEFVIPHESEWGETFKPLNFSFHRDRSDSRCDVFFGNRRIPLIFPDLYFDDDIRVIHDTSGGKLLVISDEGNGWWSALAQADIDLCLNPSPTAAG